MKKSFTFYSLLLLIVFVSSCTKERRTERILHKAGSWEVAELEYRIVSQGFVDTTLFVGALSGSEVNAGTFYFSKRDKGNYAFTYNGIPKTGNFKWSANSTGSVTIIEKTALINSIINTALSIVNEETTIYQEAYSFTLEQTGDMIFTGDGTGVLQILDSGSTMLGQYVVFFDRIVLKPK